MTHRTGFAPVEPQAAGNSFRLYHYTSPAGLRGIIENGVLWAGDAWFMNDLREARYGIELMRGALEALEPGCEIERRIREQALEAFLDFENNAGELPRSHIACLSREGDQLSQWRAYGRPRGFSIAFDYGWLLQDPHLLSSPKQPLTVQEVVYEREAQLEKFRSIFDDAVTDAKGASDGGVDRAGLTNDFLVSALQRAVWFKDPAFQEEREFRLQFFSGYYKQDSADLKFRDGAMGLTPYMEIQLAPRGARMIRALREVIVGPQPNEAEALRAVRQLLNKNGYDDVEVRPSNVPLR